MPTRHVRKILRAEHWTRIGAVFCIALLTAGASTSSHALGESINGFPKWEERVIHAWINRARSDPQVEMTACGAACGEKACYAPIAPLNYDLNLNRAARFHSDEMLRQSYFAHDSACTVVSNINSLYPATCDGSASCACVGGVKACSPACTTFAPRVSLFGASPSGEIIASPSDPEQAFYLWLFENSASPTCAFSTPNGHRWLILKSTGAVGAGVTTGGFAVGDFGLGAAPAKVPSGSHYPRQAASVDVWANWFDGAAPTVRRVNVDGVCTSMALGRGSMQNGAFKATLNSVASGCHRYYFEYKDSGNQAVTFPTTGSLGIGPAGTCPDWDIARPLSCDTPPQFTLTVSRTGSGSGTISSMPAGISCGVDCSEPYNTGTMVTLTATPAGGSLFGGWSGSSCTGTGTCAMTVSAALTVNANFTLFTVPDPPVIISAIPGNAQVTVAFNPPVSDGGSPITIYTAQCAGMPTAFNTGLTSPITVSGMNNGTSYTCGVIATNVNGSSKSSGLILVTPNTGTPLALLAVQSRKVHGMPPPFDLPIDFRIPTLGPIHVEPRTIGAGHTIVFQYNAAVTIPGTATAVDALGVSIGTTTAPQISGASNNEVSVQLNGIPDNRRVKVTLTGVNGNVNSMTSLGFLVGDVNRSRSVNASDISAIKSRQGQPTNAGNFVFDVNLTGDIAASDVTMVKSRAGMTIP